MHDHVYKSLELTGASAEGPQQAIEKAIGRASETIRNIRWFEVGEVRGSVENGKVSMWQVTMKLGFTLDE